MFQTFDFEVNIQLWPFDGILATHPDVQRTADPGIAQPRYAVVGYKVVLSQDRQHHAL